MHPIRWTRKRFAGTQSHASGCWRGPCQRISPRLWQWIHWMGSARQTGLSLAVYTEPEVRRGMQGCRGMQRYEGSAAGHTGQTISKGHIFLSFTSRTQRNQHSTTPASPFARLTVFLLSRDVRDDAAAQAPAITTSPHPTARTPKEPDAVNLPIPPVVPIDPVIQCRPLLNPLLAAGIP